MRFWSYAAIFLGVVGCVGGVWVLPAQAFEVRPAIMDLALPAGSSTERDLIVRNTDAEPIEVFFTIQKFVPGGNGQPQFLDPEEIDGLPSWVRVSARTLTLKPGEEKTVQVHIDVPTTAAAGGAYAGLFTTERPSGEGSVGIGRRIASLLLVAVDAPKVPAQFALENVGRGQAGDQGMFSTRWKNLGGSHGTAQIRLEVRSFSWFGPTQKETGQVMRLLPGEARDLVLSWQTRSPFAWVQTRAFLNDQPVQGATGSFFLVQTSGWILLAVIACVVLVGGIYGRRHWKKTVRERKMG